MNILQLIGDGQKAYQDALPLPTWTDRTSLKAWSTKLKDDGIDIVFDVGGWGQIKAALCNASPAELQALADHPFLQKLWAAFLQALPVLIPLLLKSEAPVVNTP